MYACLAASAPQPADTRMEKDRLIPAMVRWDQLLETIDWCLCLNHFSRPQSVFALQKALTEKVTKPVTKKKNWFDHVASKLSRKPTAK